MHDASALLLDTFVELADTLAGDDDVGELMQFLVERCVDLLADTAGVLLEAVAAGWYPSTTPRVGTSSERDPTRSPPCRAAWR